MEKFRAKIQEAANKYSMALLEDADEMCRNISDRDRAEFKERFDKYKKDITPTTYTHKGYTLSQTNYNYHYMIFDGNGNMVMHVPYKKPITQEMAVEFIEHYISLADRFDDIFDDLQEENEEI